MSFFTHSISICLLLCSRFTFALRILCVFFLVFRSAAANEIAIAICFRVISLILNRPIINKSADACLRSCIFLCELIRSSFIILFRILKLWVFMILCFDILIHIIRWKYRSVHFWRRRRKLLIRLPRRVLDSYLHCSFSWNQKLEISRNSKKRICKIKYAIK